MIKQLSGPYDGVGAENQRTWKKMLTRGGGAHSGPKPKGEGPAAHGDQTT